MRDSVTAYSPLGDAYKVALSKLQWRPSTYGVVISDGKILLSPQFNTGHDLPGGGIEIGEDIESAVVREVKEETGIDVEVIRLLDIRTSFFAATHNKDKKDIYYQSIAIYYLCEMVGGKISDEGFDEYEQSYAGLAEWLPVSEIENIKPVTTIDFRPIVKQALKGSKS